MNYENLAGFSLFNLTTNNIILGKNGCGKSYLFKQIEQALRSQAGVGKVRYISPERAGTLKYEPGVDQALSNNVSWMDENRRKNQSPNFKEQSFTLYRRLELLTLREIERDHTQPGYVPRSFGDVINKINTLLDRIQITRSENGFKIVVKDSGEETDSSVISSGEAELISLAIEFLSYAKECDSTKRNFLLIDEPDVHLHPDLQDRLATFIAHEISSDSLIVLLATHSTSFVGAMAREADAHLAFMKRGDHILHFSSIKESQKRILPMFGAHPLSNVFNEAPILIVEGEDDERIWQQATRSSKGSIKVYPCVAGSIDEMNEYEVEANEIIDAIYDSALGFSLRDRDDNPEAIEDIGNIVRMRLSCRAAENLILSDDVLAFAKTDWKTMQSLIAKFVVESTSHPYYGEMKAFLDSGMDRKNADLKDIRMILTGFITNKPWEVLVGQTIAGVALGHSLAGDHSLISYLGKKACAEILGV